MPIIDELVNWLTNIVVDQLPNDKLKIAEFKPSTLLILDYILVH